MAKVCILSTLYFLLIMNIECYMLTGNMNIISHGISWVRRDHQGIIKGSAPSGTRIIKAHPLKSVFSSCIQLCRSIFFWVDFCSEWTFILDLNYIFIAGRSSLLWHLCWKKKLQTSMWGCFSHLHAWSASWKIITGPLDPVKHCLWNLLRLYIKKNMSSLITHGMLCL